MPFFIPLSIVYFFEIDRRQKDPFDEYWHMGLLVLGRFRVVDPSILREHARAWFIKAFFTPFMFALVVSNVQYFLTFQWQDRSFAGFCEILITIFFTIDVIYGASGYILTFRFLDTHIRSTEPTFLGWLVVLICYSPFYSAFGIGLLNYDDNLFWSDILKPYPFLYYLVGSLIIFLALVYCLATVAFGYRFSNLTYRGVITSGPYRFTKHPAYLSKTLLWWMMSLPFISAGGFLPAIKNTLCLLVITFIYYIRARTEENHLSNYPEYVEYAQWIKKNGVFSFLTKNFPAFQYSEEKCKRWKSVVWFLENKKR